MMKKRIKEIINEKAWDYTEPNNLELAELSQELENERLINFTLEFREDQNDVWIQAEYMSKIGYPVIIDYDINLCYNSIDSFIEELESIQREINKLENNIMVRTKTNSMDFRSSINK